MYLHEEKEMFVDAIQKAREETRIIVHYTDDFFTSA